MGWDGGKGDWQETFNEKRNVVITCCILVFPLMF